MTTPKWTMPTEDEFVTWTKQEHLSLAELTAIKMYQRWLRDHMKPVTIAPLSVDELNAEAAAYVNKYPDSTFASYFDGYRAAEARILKGDK